MLYALVMELRLGGFEYSWVDSEPYTPLSCRSMTFIENSLEQLDGLKSTGYKLKRWCGATILTCMESGDTLVVSQLLCLGWDGVINNHVGITTAAQQ